MTPPVATTLAATVEALTQDRDLTFPGLLDALYHSRFTGPVHIQFIHGVPNVVEFPVRDTYRLPLKRVPALTSP